jgi:hypothetical protein
MRKFFISFGTTHNYLNSLIRIKHEAITLNFYDKVIIYTENDFDQTYLEKHGEFMKKNKGYGFWMWKSYFVKKTMEEMNDGDILVFADCGCHLVNNPIAINRLESYVKLCKTFDSGILSFQMCFSEKSYTKMDVFEKLDELNDKMMNSGQLVGGIFVLRKCQNTINLINEYYDLCQNYNLINDSESKLPNDPSFIAHRHDQSVFSILRKKRGTILIPDETWFDNFMSSEAQSKPILATRIRQ